MERKKNGAGLIKHISERKYCVIILTDGTDAEMFTASMYRFFTTITFFLLSFSRVCMCNWGPVILSVCSRLLCLKLVWSISVFFFTY